MSSSNKYVHWLCQQKWICSGPLGESPQFTNMMTGSAKSFMAVNHTELNRTRNGSVLMNTFHDSAQMSQSIFRGIPQDQEYTVSSKPDWLAVIKDHYNLIKNWTNMRVQRTRTKQLRAPLTTTLRYPKSTQCNFNSCSFNCWLDYSWTAYTIGIQDGRRYHTTPSTSDMYQIMYPYLFTSLQCLEIFWICLLVLLRWIICGFWFYCGIHQVARWFKDFV